MGRYRYHDSPPDASVGPYITKVHVGQTSRPGNVALRDFDFRRPEKELKGEYESGVSSSPEKTWQQYHYSPSGFLIETPSGGGGTPVADDKSIARHDDEEGNKQARRLLEATQFKRRFVLFETNVLHLVPGARFMMDVLPNHPRSDVATKELTVIESQVLGNASGELNLMGVAVFADDPFRVPRVTPKPRIDGVQSAIVVGPKGREIYHDEYGRVRVRFHWDREGAYDDNRTCWLRVSEGWGGAGYGAVSIPRIGHEVLVDFLDGDPDHPVVVGRLYNTVSPFPYVLPKHKTQSTWKTQTSPFTDDAFNELMFDDQKDAELVFIQAQRNMMKLTKRRETRRVGNERISVVGDHRLGVVKQTDLVHVGEQHLVQIVKEKRLNILKMEDPETKPTETFFEVRDKKITLTTGGATIVLDGSDIIIEADKGIRFSADKKLIMKGEVFLNCSSADDAAADAEKNVDDQVAKPEDRTKVEILKLLAKGDKPETVQRKFAFMRKEPRTMSDLAPKPNEKPGFFKRLFDPKKN